jgi:subtilisin family serine protease
MTFTDRARRRALAIAAGVALAVSATSPALAAQPPRSSADMRATALEPSERIVAAKSPTSRLARTDPALLARNDARMVHVIVKLDYDSVATYAGGLPGLAPTSPKVTGKPLDRASRADKAYRAYVNGKEDAFIRALAKAVPTARVGSRLNTVFGGVAARIPARSVEAILKIKGVVAVQYDALRKPLTDSSPVFMGANPVYNKLATTANAGQGIIFGDLDSGVWPEHPSFEDLGNLPRPPGPPRTCEFGDNPLTAPVDPFECNNKLIGGEAFLDTYLSDPDRAADETFTTARDSNGHGTHTTSTVAGNVLDSAPVFGVERGPIHGVAPGAWVVAYKVLGSQGGFTSDITAAIGEAIYDGVDVINFSISGGNNPFTDAAELAFLDAYQAGIVVAASAGNSGPGAGTTDHVSPWVITVAASTQTREFTSELTVTSGAATFETVGASLTQGAGPFPVVLSSAAPYSNNLCDAPAAPGTFTGKIVACQRGVVARVDKGYNVLQGGAEGMILYNATLADVETDNHWLPTVHLADGTAFKAFLNAHPGSTATFTAGTRTAGRGDVMAAFSSRGPGGLFVKPDVTAPGVQILAGHTPVPESITGGPPGEYFQAIAGTSMSAPHVAGAAILVRAVHPFWTPGQVKSALMTSARTSVVKENLMTPADPLDMGAGRIDVAAAVAAPLTFDETAANFFDIGNDPLYAIDLNLPSVNAPVMPGRVITTRTAVNSSGRTQSFTVATTSPANSLISVSPTSFTLAPGKAVKLTITIKSSAPPSGTHRFGQIRITAGAGVGTNRVVTRLHLPVAFVKTQGDVKLAQTCSPTQITVGSTTLCSLTATNKGFTDQEIDLATTTSSKLSVTTVLRATKVDNHTVRKQNVLLAGGQPGVPSVAPLGFEGYFSLEGLGVPGIPVGDEEVLNFDVPRFFYGGVPYTRIGVDTNGYVVVGGGSADDNECCDLPAGPSPDRPNNILAPFWTDLDGSSSDGLFVAELTDGADNWIVVEYQLNVVGTTDLRTFQVWIGVNGVEDISYSYLPADLPFADPNGQDFLVGAENVLGEGEMVATLPSEDLRVTSTAPTPGQSYNYKVRARGTSSGSALVNSSMTATFVPGVTTVSTAITIRN